MCVGPSKPEERVSNASSGEWGDLCLLTGDDDRCSDGDGDGDGGDSSGDVPEASGQDARPHVAQIEARDELSHDEFAARYRHRRPVLLRGAANAWPALVRWADASQLRALLPEEVLVLRAPDGRRFLKRDCAHQRWALSAVVDELFGAEPRETGGGSACGGAREESGAGATPPPPRGSRLYARAPLKGGLRSDVRLDALEQLVGGAPGAHEFKEQNCGVWMGSAGCVTPLHYDLCHGFLVGVRGTKDVTYYCPDDFGALYARPDQPELSTVDLDAWRQGDATAAGRAEREAHPAFAEATEWRVELRKGDVLYTPPFWWHHVETTDAASALSVLVPFDPTADEPVHACHFR